MIHFVKTGMGVAAVLMAVAGHAAEPVAIEVFDLPGGSALNTTAAGNGWSSGWKADIGLTTSLAATYVAATGSLTSAAFESHGLTASGNRFQSPDSAVLAQLWRGLSAPVNWDSDSTVYVSCLIQWGGNHASSSSRLKLMLGDVNTYAGVSGNGTDSNKMRLMARNTTGSTGLGATLYDAGVTYLMVMKITTVASGSDSISLTLFAPGATVVEPAVWDLTQTAVRIGTASVLGFETQLYVPSRESSLDELRIGSSWESVTAAQKKISLMVITGF